MLANSTITEQDDGGLYALALSSVTDFNGSPIDCRKLESLHFSLKWTVDSGSARAGRFKLQTTNDPRAVSDPDNAAWKDRTIPSGGYDGDATVSGTTITIDDSAGQEELSVDGLPAFARLIWDNTTAGTDGEITIWVFGRLK